MLSLNCLSTAHCNLKKALSPVVDRFTSPSDQATILSQLDAVTKLRKTITSVKEYRGDNDTELYKSYYGYITAVAESFPSGYAGCPVSISWSGSLFGRESMQTSSLFVELAATMFNLAALHTQKGYVKVTNTLDIATIDRATESLQTAVDLFQTIASYVSYLYLDSAVLPELRYATLIFLRDFCLAQIQYLKAIKSCRKDLSTSSRVVVFMGARRLYGNALESLSKAGLSDSLFREHIRAMMELCYVQALFYHSYMTKAQLDDYTVHGTGVAYSCMTSFMETKEKLESSRVPSVQKEIVPLLEDFASQVETQLKAVLEEWRLRQSRIPSSAECYMPDRVIVSVGDAKLIEPTLSFAALFEPNTARVLEDMKKRYLEFVKETTDKLVSTYRRIKEEATEVIRFASYHVTVAAADQSGRVPAYYENLIAEVRERETKNYFERWQRQYFRHRDAFFASIEQLEKEQTAVTSAIASHPTLYPENLKEYVQSVVLPLLANARRAEAVIKTGETDIATWMEVKDKEAFGYVLASGDAKLQEAMKVTYPMEERGEELISRINGKEKEMEEAMKDADRCFEVAQQIAKTTYTLVADFVVMGADVEKGDRFPVYFAPCKEAFDRSITMVRTYSSYLTTLSHYSSDYDAMLQHLPAYRQRSTLLAEMNTCIRAYFKILHFYEPNDSICQMNSQKINAVVSGLQQCLLRAHS